MFTTVSFGYTMSRKCRIVKQQRVVLANRLLELVSETMPHYMSGEAAPNATIQRIYDLIDEGIQDVKVKN